MDGLEASKDAKEKLRAAITEYASSGMGDPTIQVTGVVLQFSTSGAISQESIGGYQYGRATERLGLLDFLGRSVEEEIFGDG